MIKTADDIQTVIVIGAGVMGEGIAQSFAEAGFNVQILDIHDDALARCQSQIASNLQLGLEAGALTDTVDNVMARINTSNTKNMAALLQHCDMVVESAPELIALKREIFAQLDQAPDHVLLASNTGSFTVSEITKGMNTPERVVGLHYFNPAHLIPAVEVHKGADTSEERIEQAMEIMRRVGKIPVRVRKEIPGFIINRLTGALSREVDHLIDEGVVTPEDLDAAMKASLGFRLAQVGMMEGRDFIGLDTDVRVSKNVYPQLSTRTLPSQKTIDLVEQGDLGVKSGRGYYDYAGRSREDVLRARNEKLLKQLEVFRAMHNKDAS